MKKLIIIFCMFFVLAGCTSIKNETIDNILSNALKSHANIVNVKRKGYNYYLPKGLNVLDSTDYNEIITDNKYNYYLFVDVVSYINKVEEKYEFNPSVFLSRTIEIDDKYGYLEINKLENEKYLIEIMYNYAKIEVMVDYDNINNAVAYAAGVLSSITYNNNVLANLNGADLLNFTEEEFNIFETVSSDSNYLKYEEEYKYVDDDIPDTDLVG